MDDLTITEHRDHNASASHHSGATSEPTRAERCSSILDGAIREGSRRTAAILTALQTSPPRDQLLRTRSAGFEIEPSLGLRVRVGDEWLTPTDFAFGQLAARANVPLPYLRELADPKADDWKHELAAEILHRHYGHLVPGRVLVRSVHGQLRGWLSDKYRRIDSRPLIDALAREALELGAVPIDAVATETRVALKLVHPRILEPIPGEFMVLGGEWSNSDYGNGAHSFRSFALRVACLNGMTAENLLKQVHLGGRLAEDITFSDRTHRLDTAANVSALRDVVRAAFEPDSRNRILERIQTANAQAMSASQLAHTTRSLPKTVQRSIVDAFDSHDVVNLPPGQTAWRASNAISWIARHTEDAESRLDLERVAGTLV